MVNLLLTFVLSGISLFPTPLSIVATVSAPEIPTIQAAQQPHQKQNILATTANKIRGKWQCKAEASIEGVRLWMDGQTTYTSSGSSKENYTFGIATATWTIETTNAWRMKGGKLCEKMDRCKTRPLNDAARKVDRMGGNICEQPDSRKESCYFVAMSGNTMEQHHVNPAMTLKCRRIK